MPPLPSDSAPRGTRPLRTRLAEGLLLLVAGALLFGGAFTFLRARERRVVHETQLGGLGLRLEVADWVRDDMLHPGTAPFGMPASMTPGMPDAESQRLSIEFTVQNLGEDTQTFDVAELSLRAPDGSAWEADPGPDTRVRLPPHHLYASVVQFDVPEAMRDVLTLHWKRAGGEAVLLSTEVPRHEEPADAAPQEWPATVATLPTGRASEGALLFERKFACSSCHGQPEQPGTNTVGPPLLDFARVAASRVIGKSAAQYAYESILTPDAFVAPQCAQGMPCATPSAMPRYGELMSKQDMADLLAFMLTPRLANSQ